MSDERKRLAQKIVKLFALGASSSNDSEIEVEAAITKARALMLEHSLSVEDLRVLGGQGANEAIVKLTTQGCYTLKQKFANYDDMIGAAVGVVTDTQTYSTVKWERGQRYWTRMFVGDEGDVAVAGELFLVLLDQMRKLARARFGPGWSGKHAQYCRGFANKLLDRAKKFVPEPDLPVASRDRYALIVVKKKNVVDEWVAKNLVKKPIRLKMDREFSIGQQDAGQVDLGDPRRRVKS